MQQSQRDPFQSSSPDAPPLPAPELGDRLGPFLLLDRIGQGGSSIVYSAVDESSGRTCALKLLLTTCDLAIDRLKRGFRALADLYHPNLVCLERLHFAPLPKPARGDRSQASRESRAAEDGHGVWFITMEQIHGSELIEFARRQMDADQKRSFQWLEELLRQIGAALSALHSRELVHRDIKPSNFMVEPSGRLRLLDYGLIGSFEPWFGGASTNSYVAGTLPYMAPEVLTQRIYPPASDIYSVGRVVLEIVSGELPATDREAGEDPEAWRREIGQQLPSDMPARLRELCIAMLEFDPAERPTAWNLERLGCRDSPAVQLPAWVRDQPLPPIGREAEVAQVSGWIREVIRGREGTLHLSGPSGIGKTSLLDESVQSARAEWIEVMRARCRQREALPLRAFDEPMNAVARRIVSGAYPPLCLSDADRRAVAALFPALAPALGSSPSGGHPPSEPLAGDETQRRHAAIEAVVQLFTALGQERPILLVIDDLQWADADSMALLRRLMAAMPPRLGILTAGRPEFAARELPFGRCMELEGVSAASACAIVCSRVRRRGLEISEARVRELCKDAAGNPYLLTHIGDLTDEQETPQAGFDDLWGIRRRRLTPAARLMIELLATADRPVPVSHLCALTECAASDRQRSGANAADDSQPVGQATSPAAAFPGARPVQTSPALAELRHETLVRDFGPDAATVEMYHDRITEAVRRSAGEPACRSHHRRWALWLTTHGGRPGGGARGAAATEMAPPDAEIASHWIAGGRPAAALKHAVQAAETARERLALADAAHWYAWTAEYVIGTTNEAAQRAASTAEREPEGLRSGGAKEDPGLPSANGLMQAAAECYATCGRSQRAAEFYVRLAERDGGTRELLYRRFAAENYIRAGCLKEARNTIAAVAPRLKLPVLRAPWIMKLTILWNLLRLRALGPIDPAAPGQAPDPRQFERIDAELNLCRGMSLFDSLYTGALITAGMLHAARYGDRRRMLEASVAYAVLSSYDAGETASRRIDCCQRSWLPRKHLTNR